MKPNHALQAVAGSFSGILDRSQIFQISRWGYFLGAAIFAVMAGCLSYEYLDLPQTYPDLIVGSIAWENGSKFRDYITLFNIILVFLCSFFVISILVEKIGRRIGWVTERGFHDLVVYLSLPAVLGAAGTVMSRNSPLPYTAVSALLILVGMGFASMLLAFRKFRSDEGKADAFLPALQNIMLLVLGTTAAGAALGIALNRIAAVMNVSDHFGSDAFGVLIGSGFLVGLVTVFVLLRYSADPEGLICNCRRAVLKAQYFFPLFFLILVPFSIQSPEGKLQTIAQLSPLGYCVIFACMLASYMSLRRIAMSGEKMQSEDLFSVIPLMSFLAVLLFLKVSPFNFFSAISQPLLIPGDDYHFGEYLVPWWSWTEKGMLPFWDYAPARGLINYYPGFFSDLFLDGMVPGFAATTPFLYLITFLPALLLLSRMIGPGASFIALFLSCSFNGYSEIDLFVTIYLAMLCHASLRYDRRIWLALYVCLSPLILLIAPGQGALAIIAVSPLWLYQCIGIFRNGRMAEFRPALIAGLLILVFSALTPLWKMLFGAFRYGLEQSGLNSVANGKEWDKYFYNYDLNPWLAQAVRSLWIPVAIFAGLLIIRSLTMRDASHRKRVLTYAIPVFILLVMFIIRAVGRIDKGILSRPGTASIWAVSLLLPLLLFSSTVMRSRARLICLWVFAGGLLISVDRIKSFSELMITRTNIPAADTKMALSATAGMKFYRQGNGYFANEHYARLQSIKTLLDKVLDPGETYLDLTSRHANYFYVNRKPPVESGAVYNLLSEKQQLRGIRTIESLKPPVILLWASNFNADGGGPALRSYHLYRYLLLSPGSDIVTLKDGTIWLVRTERLSRIPPALVASIHPVDASVENPLNAVFAADRSSPATAGQYLKQMPASWGRSAESLRSKMRELWRLGPGEWYPTPSVAPDRKGGYLLKDERSDLVFAIHAKNLKGKDAGLLSFEVQCTPADRKPELAIYWSGKGVPPNDERTRVRFKARNGRMIVPMDAVPSWLLSPALETLMIVTESRDSASVIRISDVRLMQRK